MEQRICRGCGGTVPPKDARKGGPQRAYCPQCIPPRDRRVVRRDLPGAQARLTCKRCSRALVGRQRQFCSKRCGDIARGMVRAEPLAERQCEECGTEFTPWIDIQRFCTDACGRRAGRRRYNERSVPAACEQCGVEFNSRRTGSGQARYCSVLCSCRANAAAKRTARCSTEGCDEYPNRGRKSGTMYCDGCYAVVLADREARRKKRSPKPRVWYAGNCVHCGEAFVFNQPNNRTCSPRCGQRFNKDTRKQRKRAAYIEEVWRPKVYARDGWTCQLCSKPVDRTKTVPHPRAPTIDHIVPIARGGEHSYANTQLACFMCNCLKSDDLPTTAQLRLAV